MKLDLWELYRQMLRSRIFEEAVMLLWNAGKISGEMHMGIGEEAIAAGVVSQLREGDAMALDHRATPQFIMNRVDPVALLQELLGHPEGLCHGMGGHMHLFSKEHLMASSGIVGSSGPAAAGFALAAKHLRPKAVSVAFFGEGAMNQGMMMESMNLAAVWKLPVIFVCKDNQWSISTSSSSVTGGELCDRAKSFGMPAWSIDGLDVEAVSACAEKAVKLARHGKGPSFMLAGCVHPEGHFLGYSAIRIVRHPVREMKKLAGPMIGSVVKIKGASPGKRIASLGAITSLLGKTAIEYYWKKEDPVKRARKKLRAHKERLHQLEEEVKQEINDIIESVIDPSVLRSGVEK